VIGIGLPTAADLTTALGVRPDEKRVVRALLTPPANSLAIGEWWIEKQAWSWRGLPVPDCQTWPAGGFHDDAWSQELFSQFDDRFDSWRTRAKGFSKEAPAAEEDFGAIPQAQAIRYRVAAVSRYAPLLGPAARDVTPLTDTATSADVVRSVYSTWKGAVLPPNERVRPAPTPPSIHAIIPASSGTPGSRVMPLLVVLAEPAFAQAGVTEGLRVRVARESPDKDGVAVEELQHGVDPVLYGQLSAPLGDVGFTVTGPLGHGLDSRDLRGRPLRACTYLLTPDASVRPWSFLRVQFQRVADNLSPAGSGASSAWTDPMWVQFPASSDFVEKAVPGNNGRMVISINPPVDAALSTNTTSFGYRALLTKFVAAQGSANSLVEAYVDTVEAHLDETGLTVNLDPTLGNLCVRIAEVQFASATDRASLPVHDDFWRALFGLKNAPDVDVPFRVTRISAPVGDQQLWPAFADLAKKAFDFYASFFGLRAGVTQDRPLTAEERNRWLLLIRAVAWVETRHGTANAADPWRDPLQCGVREHAWWSELTGRTPVVNRFVAGADGFECDSNALPRLVAQDHAFPPSANLAALGDASRGNLDPAFSVEMSFFWAIPYLLQMANARVSGGSTYMCGECGRPRLLDAAEAYGGGAPGFRVKVDQALADLGWPDQPNGDLMRL